jgi:hypothetical protein
LLGRLIWQYAFTTSASNGPRPDAEDANPARLTETGSLPYHPFFRGWFARNERIDEVARMLVEHSIATDRETVRAWAVQLAPDALAAPAIEHVRVRLCAMSEWLRRAKEEPLARLSDVAAETVGQLPPGQHPLIVSMCELGLDIAMHTLP